MDNHSEAIWNAQDSDVFVLGAGFSACVTGGAAPVMRNFFQGLDRSKYQDLSRFLSDEFGDAQSANVEEVLLTLDQISTCPPKLNRALFSFGRDHYGKIRKDLCKYCIEQLCGLQFAESGMWAVNLLASVSEACTVLTTNYDNLAERILSGRSGMRHWAHDSNCPHCKMRHLLTNDCGCHVSGPRPPANWKGALIKLHGSIAWTRCVNRSCCNVECLSPDIHCRPQHAKRCVVCGMECTPVIVLPSMAKHLNEYPEIAVMWNSAHHALACARSMLVFGFSFPTSDALLTHTIRHAFESNLSISRIAIIDRHPEDVATRVVAILPKSARVDITTFAVPEDGLTPPWLTSILDETKSAH